MNAIKKMFEYLKTSEEIDFRENGEGIYAYIPLPADLKEELKAEILKNVGEEIYDVKLRIDRYPLDMMSYGYEGTLLSEAGKPMHIFNQNTGKKEYEFLEKMHHAFEEYEREKDKEEIERWEEIEK